MEPQKPKNQGFPYLPLLLILGGVGIYFLLNRPSTKNPVTENTSTSQVRPVIEEEEPEPSANQVNPVQNEVRATVEGSPFKFSPNTISAKVGDKIIVTFKNMEGTHDFVIDEFNVATKMTKTGETDTVEFIADKAGVFEYYCSVGEHRKMGMVGTLTVE
ncbi:TPA: hypothetical protein DHW62_03905 [candidate division WWE3 bacterium]|uniref:Blue (type 1) copper domain-containing protein n=1 Tax=candidate division WWE3 bacterium TaxID=2053526 RepID=A0A656PMV1_UNCKA|nr:Blue (Type 1) copper protein [candidate division WWE3 bacterium RAAC2_WWE3_1]KKS29704.1 MAG: Blue (Type 1) copper domain-containing protein [candidate division WWE3 bacterium GW2011_GWB1_42_117]KKS55514.1 MAG: Blue (Type 1) copper domain-containing protein [candidate division WWE3 bacterium GW2011_GWD2_42_34]KKT05999.1 MAG: Blue (Type 1) copper domain-containing protein [candidate division WWE3 bacterium GW2011_GWE2_43_18]KKT06917.1 MAG: Blue (Type 1) copper domain-containing protein [candid